MKLWIARESDNLDLYAYDTEPWYDDDDEGWMSNGNCYVLDLMLFPEITFENIPHKVEIKLVKKE